MNITGHTVEKLHDPTGILSGDRYEFFLTLEVPNDDELFSEHGLYLKVTFVNEEEASKIAQYQFIEQTTEQYLDFALEEEEEELVKSYCQQNIKS
ncbi:DUF6509 family protein [Bacillus sp. 2205SS5-2]|uniref:DUF6509 family protein n=1 Tax=Bacillus sp. 2205SS5-2 TaxID=3109031 RepID=UPI00300680A4